MVRARSKSNRRVRGRRGPSRRNAMVAVPAAMSYGQMPTRTKGIVTNDQMVLSFSEMIMVATVPPSTAPAQNVPFWPGASGCSRLDAFAGLYSQYRVESLEFQYRPAVGTSTSGIYVAGFVYDQNDVPSNLSATYSILPRVSDVPWVAGTFRVPVDRVMKSNWHYTATGSNPSGFGPAGSVVFHASGTNGTILGNVWVNYRIRFSGPFSQVDSMTTLNTPKNAVDRTLFSTIAAQRSAGIGSGLGPFLYGRGTPGLSASIPLFDANTTPELNYNGTTGTALLDTLRTVSLTDLLGFYGYNINPNQFAELIMQWTIPTVPVADTVVGALLQYLPAGTSNNDPSANLLKAFIEGRYLAGQGTAANQVTYTWSVIDSIANLFPSQFVAQLTTTAASLFQAATGPSSLNAFLRLISTPTWTQGYSGTYRRGRVHRLATSTAAPIDDKTSSLDSDFEKITI